MAKSKKDSFSAEERAAMRALVAERKAESDKAATAKLAREAIAALPPADRKLAEWLHETVAEIAPELTARTWYGMPAYARDGQVICFFQGASKFKVRYATLGFSDKAKLDEGRMWPTSYALTDLGPKDKERVKALIRQALG